MSTSKLKLNAGYGNKGLVDQYIQYGQKAMKEKDYAKARENFDKAISFGGKDISLLDYQVQPYIELEEWHRTAMEIIKQMTAKWPNDYRGYYRQAKLLDKMSLHHKAVESIKLAIKFGPTRAQHERLFRSLNMYRGDLLEKQLLAEKKIAESSRAEKQKLEAAKLAARKSKINYIHLLSRDVIITIAEQGLAYHPGFAVKMAGVCRGWRETLLNQGSLWTTLVLGNKRTVERVKMCLDRTRGNIKELKFLEDFDRSKVDIVTELLGPTLPNIKRLTILCYPHDITAKWQGQFHSLRYLKVVAPTYPLRDEQLAYGLLSEEATNLRELELEGGHYRHLTVDQPGFDADDDEEPPFWTSSARVHFASLRSLRLNSCIIHCLWPDHSELLRFLPEIQTIVMNRVVWEYAVTGNNPLLKDWTERRRARGLDITLPDMKNYTVSGDVRTLALNGISAPAMENLDLWSANLRGSSIVPHIFSPGLEHALPTLVSLDIGRIAITLADMLEVLPRLPGLKFLNVSYCALDNNFLEALERKNKESDLVPNLIALSIAGNTEITAGPLRRFVLSRTPGGIKPQTPPSSQTNGVKGGNAFRPTPVKSSPFAPSRAGSQSQSRPSGSDSSMQEGPKSKSASSQSSATSVFAARPESVSSGLTSTSERPRIQWLNLDYCERIEPEAIDHLRSRLKVRFVSQLFGGKVDENRIRGKGRYAWDAGYEDGCASGESGCTLRKVPGTKDSYHIHHTCQKEIPPEPSQAGWTRLSQTSSSTFPSSEGSQQVGYY